MHISDGQMGICIAQKDKKGHGPGFAVMPFLCFVAFFVRQVPL